MVKKNKEEIDKNGVGGYEWEYANVIDNRTTCEKIRNFIYNPNTHAFLGRTAKSWGAILLFYMIFYSCLALLFAICMKVLIMSIDDTFPKWQQAESIIGTNPGLGFRPMANNTEAASLIWYSADNGTNVKLWTESIDRFLSIYTESSSLHTNCSHSSYPKGDSICNFHLHELNDCSPQEGYGYKKRQPCVFIKLNRIYGWEPDYYKSNDTFPRDMPDDLVEHIEHLKDPTERNMVWVSCTGESVADNQNIGPLKYFPKRGFPGYYYPYEHVNKGYRSPLVAVQFLKPRENTLINVECRAWAKNIAYKKSAHQREGSVHFELQVD